MYRNQKTYITRKHFPTMLEWLGSTGKIDCSVVPYKTESLWDLRNLQKSTSHSLEVLDEKKWRHQTYIVTKEKQIKTTQKCRWYVMIKSAEQNRRFLSKWNIGAYTFETTRMMVLNSWIWVWSLSMNNPNWLGSTGRKSSKVPRLREFIQRWLGSGFWDSFG